MLDDFFNKFWIVELLAMAGAGVLLGSCLTILIKQVRRRRKRKTTTNEKTNHDCCVSTDRLLE